MEVGHELSSLGAALMICVPACCGLSDCRWALAIAAAFPATPVKGKGISEVEVYIYVGAIWCISHLLQLPQQNVCCMSKSTTKHHVQKLD